MHVIQYRDFLPTLVSDYDLFVRNGGDDTEQRFRQFASAEWSYYRDFRNKWVDSEFARENHVLRYEDLVADVVSQMASITALFAPSHRFEEDKMRAIASEIPHITVSAEGEVVTKASGIADNRKIEAFRFYTPQLFDTLGKLRLSRKEINSTFMRLHNCVPKEADYLDLQCLESVSVLEAVIAGIPYKS